MYKEFDRIFQNIEPTTVHCTYNTATKHLYTEDGRQIGFSDVRFHYLPEDKNFPGIITDVAKLCQSATIIDTNVSFDITGYTYDYKDGALVYIAESITIVANIQNAGKNQILFYSAPYVQYNGGTLKSFQEYMRKEGQDVEIIQA